MIGAFTRDLDDMGASIDLSGHTYGSLSVTEKPNRLNSYAILFLGITFIITTIHVVVLSIKINQLQRDVQTIQRYWHKHQ